MKDVYVNSLISVFKQEITALKIERSHAKSDDVRNRLNDEINERSEALLSLLRGLAQPRFF